MTPGDLRFDLSEKMTEMISKWFFASFRTLPFVFLYGDQEPRSWGGVQTPPPPPAGGGKSRGPAGRGLKRWTGTYIKFGGILPVNTRVISEKPIGGYISPLPLHRAGEGLNFTPFDNLYIPIMLKIGFSGVNNPRKKISWTLSPPGLINPGFQRYLAHCATVRYQVFTDINNVLWWMLALLRR